MHASGQVHVRSHMKAKETKLIVRGNILKAKDTSGVRHLFTMFPKEPSFIPESSPAFNRASDHAIITAKFIPMVIIFFAVPNPPISRVNLNFGFGANELEIPPHSGGGSLDLRYHRICWFSYKTKHMNQWPKKTYICYYDGCVVPLYIAHQGIDGIPGFPFELRGSKTTYISNSIDELIIIVDGSNYQNLSLDYQ